MSSAWIDISVPVFSGMVHWPGNPPVQIEHMLDRERGDAATVSKRWMGAQSGTHVDAPCHFLPGGQGIDAAPLAALIGPARVLEISDPVSIAAEALTARHIQRGERVLFKTRNSARCWQTNDLVQDFVYLSQAAARYLAAQQVQVVGVDYLSVGGFYQGGPETHQALLAVGVWIIEGLHLAAVQPGRYELLCLPLKMVGGDGAPARAVLRKAG
jgi:arylformamidase